MADRNAKNFILLSRSGAKGKDALELIDEMKLRGIRIAAPVCDISDEDALSTAFRDCKMPPIKGCIQASMVLKVSPACFAFTMGKYTNITSRTDSSKTSPTKISTLPSSQKYKGHGIYTNTCPRI